MLSLWSHIHYQGDTFVTSDQDFLQETKKPALIALGAGDILTPQEVVAKLKGETDWVIGRDLANNHQITLHQNSCKKKNLNGTQAKDLIDAFFEAMTESIIQGERIEARGFGVFEVKETNPRKARNPRTGEQFFLRVRRKVMFKPGKVLKGELSKPFKM